MTYSTYGLILFIHFFGGILMRIFGFSFPILMAGLTCAAQPALANTCDTKCTTGQQNCVTAALYPYVPNIENFATAICSAWTADAPGQQLYLIKDGDVWDGGYTSNPVYTDGSGNQTPIDVFTYDAMYLQYWETQTAPIAANYITDASDFADYATARLGTASGAMTALPMLGCTNLMFYRSGDAALDGVSTFTEYLTTNGSNIFKSPVPFDETSVMYDMSGKTTAGVDYMIYAYMNGGTYPALTDPLDPTIISALTQLSERSSYYNALTGAIPPLPGVEDAYIRAGYLSEGYGRTTIGFSESMSQMTDTTRDNIKLKAFPWSTAASSKNMFYSDVVGVNIASPALGQGNDAPYMLANVMTRADVMQASIAPSAADVSYLFPARKSVLADLANIYPPYEQMQTVLNDQPTELVVMPTTDRTAFHSFGGTVRDTVKTDFSGGCDIETSTPIYSNSNAAQVCPAVCSSSGGWSGSWTNEAPPAWPNYTACGCNTCTQDSPVPPQLVHSLSVVKDPDHPVHLRYQRN
ncbi:MAG: thiamine pyridinylase [Akkermansiaceae bacterium]